jgi:predicted AlkP superfamily phosphohydrolase/phosphomutase
LTSIIFGLDGASLSNIKESMDRVDLPNFRRLFESGTKSDLLSIYPYVTGPAWTSIFSGVNPGKHGIFDQYVISSGKFIAPNMRKTDVAFLWDYFSWAGKKALVMGVPFIYPAPKINGIFVNGAWAPALSCYPEIVAKSVDLSGFDYASYAVESSEKLFEMMLEKGVAYWSERLISDITKRQEASLKLIDSQNWDLIVLVDAQPDELFHINYGDHAVTDKMFSALDKWLGELLKRMRENDTLFVVSDHGFSGIQGSLYINQWLKEKKYLFTKESLFSKILVHLGLNWDLLSRPNMVSSMYTFVLRKFPRLASFAKSRVRKGLLIDNLNPDPRTKVMSFSSNGPVAWLKVVGRNTDEINITTEHVIRDLAELKESGVLKNIFRTKDLYYGKYIENAIGPILIESREGLLTDTTKLHSGNLIGKQVFTNKGNHRREGLLLSYGKDLLLVSDKPQIYDIVPTVLSMAKLPLPRYLDGKPMTLDKNITSWLNIAQSS